MSLFLPDFNPDQNYILKYRNSSLKSKLSFGVFIGLKFSDPFLEHFGPLTFTFTENVKKSANGSKS